MKYVQLKSLNVSLTICWNKKIPPRRTKRVKCGCSTCIWKWWIFLSVLGTGNFIFKLCQRCYYIWLRLVKSLCQVSSSVTTIRSQRTLTTMSKVSDDTDLLVLPWLLYKTTMYYNLYMKHTLELFYMFTVYTYKMHMHMLYVHNRWLNKKINMKNKLVSGVKTC